MDLRLCGGRKGGEPYEVFAALDKQILDSCEMMSTPYEKGSLYATCYNGVSRIRQLPNQKLRARFLKSSTAKVPR